VSTQRIGVGACGRMNASLHRYLGITVALVLPITTTLYAGPKTDVVRLANGDHITGEVKRLERGRLTFSTDDGGTIYFEWDNVAHLESVHQFEVATTDDRRFFGSLGPAPDRFLAIVGPVGIGSLAMAEVTAITPMGSSFLSKLDGSFDAGFSYTRSSGVAQLNLNSETEFRRPRFTGRLIASVTGTRQKEGGRDDRGSLEASYVRHRWPRWFVSATGRFESNESLGLRLRSQIGGAIGPRLINSNRAQMFLGTGLAFNDERGVDSDATQNVEAVVLFGTSYFTYDQPRTNVDLSFQYYPSLSDTGRHRLQLDAGFKREVWKDFFVALNVFDTFDSRPPNPTAETNDVGTVLSIGWTY
jgi:Protein of unknown function, DUF481